MNAKRILLVEDDPDVALLLAETLEECGHLLCVAHEAKSALERCKEFRPDIALLDLGLPDMDGFELARALRAATDNAGLTLFALTGYSGDNDRKQAAQAGFQHFLVKPLMPDDLKRAIDALEESQK